MTDADATTAIFRRIQLAAVVIAIGLLAVSALGWQASPKAFHQAWLMAFLLWSGLAFGCLALLMAGHLLGDPWLGPIRGELEAGSLTFPILAVLALPLAIGLPELYPWARPGEPASPPVEFRANWLDPDFFLLRSAAYLAIWIVLAWLMTRPGRHHPRVAAVGLVLMLVTATLAGIDWVMSLEPEWLSSLYGLAIGISHLVGAFAAAILVAALRPDREPPERIGSMAGALLILVIASAYLWFSHFLVVWSANLPDEVAWYIERSNGWSWLMPWLVLVTTLPALFLLMAPRTRKQRWALCTAAVLLLVQHVAHLFWQVRPATDGPVLHWLDLVAVLALGFCCLALFARTLPGRPVYAGG